MKKFARLSNEIHDAKNRIRFVKGIDSFPFKIEFAQKKPITPTTFYYLGISNKVIYLCASFFYRCFKTEKAEEHGSELP